jgi:hypothetical protein
MTPAYATRFGSLASHEKGRVEPIADDVRHYALSNCFDVASRSRAYERVVFGQNQQYVLEVARAEGNSPWYTCAHDEFALVMDGEVEIHLVKNDAPAIGEGAHRLPQAPQGARMGWMKLTRGHQGLLPAGSCYQFRAARPAVLVIQTCKGPESVEKWAEICQLQ